MLTGLANHLANNVHSSCPLTKFEGGLNLLQVADDDAAIRLESTATAALTKLINTVHL